MDGTCGRPSMEYEVCTKVFVPFRIGPQQVFPRRVMLPQFKAPICGAVGQFDAFPLRNLLIRANQFHMKHAAQVSGPMSGRFSNNRLKPDGLVCSI